MSEEGWEDSKRAEAGEEGHTWSCLPPVEAAQF